MNQHKILQSCVVYQKQKFLHSRVEENDEYMSYFKNSEAIIKIDPSSFMDKIQF